MANKAREYSRLTKRRLDTLSGNLCASPGCARQLIAKDGETIISKICHIEGASAKGPRFNPDMSDDERRHYNNLILLCDECHSIIDSTANEHKYSVALLKEWKDKHESKQVYSKISTNPSMLVAAIDKISSVDFHDANDDETGDINAFEIGNKIAHNAIKRNKALIEEYKVFYGKINSLYSELELQGSFKKERLLRNIKHIYLKIKGNYVNGAANEMQIVRDNADNIIEDIENKLLDLTGTDNGQHYEDISFGISVIMVDAFMRCKILEEPTAE